MVIAHLNHLHCDHSCWLLLSQAGISAVCCYSYMLLRHVATKTKADVLKFGNIHHVCHSICQPWWKVPNNCSWGSKWKWVWVSVNGQISLVGKASRTLKTVLLLRNPKQQHNLNMMKDINLQKIIWAGSNVFEVKTLACGCNSFHYFFFF